MANKDDTSTTTAPPAAAARAVGGVSLGEEEQKRAQVAVAQANLNALLERMGSSTRLAVDGKWDAHTDRAFKQVCRVLGVTPQRTVRTYQLIAGAVARLTDEERARAASDGAAFAEKLRLRFAQEREQAGRGLGGTPLPREEAQRAFIASVQRDLNAFHRKLRTGVVLAVDGKWDAHTERAFKQVCRVLGISPLRTARTYRIIGGAVASRTPQELEKAKTDGAAFARKLRANGLPPLGVLGGPSMSRAARERAYTATVQSAINQHIVRLGSPVILAVDGKWGEHTEAMFKRVCLLLGVAPVRNMRTYRIIGGALAERTAAERERAEKTRAAVEKQLREEFAHLRETMPKEPPKDKMKRPVEHKDEKGKGGKGGKGGKPVVRPSDAKLIAAIERHGGRYAKEIVAASKATGAPVALLCTILAHESGFRNIYGRDPGPNRNPIRSPDPPGVLEVTEENYRRYRNFVKAGKDPNGVGPAQLTTISYVDRADKYGGAWKPANNIRVGAEVILEKIKGPGGGDLRKGIEAYNGSGPAARAYAEARMKELRVWQQRLGTGKAAAAGPRTLRVTSPLMEGSDVKQLQRAVNARYKAWGAKQRVDVDGKYGDGTRQAAREVAFGLGIARSAVAKGISPAVRRLIADPNKRTPAQKERAAKRGEFRKKLSRGPDVSTLLRGNAAPKTRALLDIIVDAHNHGLVVTSTTGGTHAKGSLHYSGQAVDFGVMMNPFSAEGQKRFLAFQHKLARTPGRFYELIGPDVHKNVKRGVFIRYPASTEAAHKNHVHVGMV